ncbi:MAG: sigma 54-interacting transcriptional regulator [candidate division Zixibacteria bacterium]|nr:sigma 54-interacting transcriptional regulator [candidate division Zixibacteria bacterium]
MNSFDSIFKELNVIYQHELRGRYQFAYLKAKRLYNQIVNNRTKLQNHALIAVLGKLCTLANNLNRLSDSSAHFADLIKQTHKCNCSRLPLLCESGKVAITLGNIDDLKEIIKLGKAESQSLQHNKFTLELLRLEALLYIETSKNDQGNELLQSILKQAIKLDLPENIAAVYFSIGILNLRQGEYQLALGSFQSGQKAIRNHTGATHWIPIHSALANLYYRLANYKNAIKMAKKAVRSYSDGHKNEQALDAYRILVLAYLKLNEFNKAEYWLQHYRNLGMCDESGRSLAIYYMLAGILQHSRDDFENATGSFYSALQVAEKPEMNMIRGEVYMRLANVALQTGDIDKCSDWLRKARPIFRNAGDKHSQARINLLKILNDVYNRKKSNQENLKNATIALFNINSVYHTGVALFHLLLVSDLVTVSTEQTLTNEYINQLHNSDGPLLKAVLYILDCTRDKNINQEENIIIWKNVLALFKNQGHGFLRILIIIKIAEYYSEVLKESSARKYLRYARNLLEGLRNKQLIYYIDDQLDKVLPQGGIYSHQIAAFTYTSDILKNINDYEKVLQSLIKLAVNQTGAERGAFLLYSKGSDKLQVKAYLNCDNESLRDIETLSKSITLASVEKKQTLSISNAQTDKRTQKFKSVILYNITSVLCVPILHGEDKIGVLYLDHHTLPALFEEADLVFIISMVDFISSILLTSKDYRTQILTNDKLQQDLNHMGYSQIFITQDSTLLDMLTKITEIAKTNANVLILGESGTGKEIISHLIHDGSIRSNGPFVSLNCGAIASDLIVSELFGIAKGVATGVDRREGKFQSADGGTLFLDEIGDMPLKLQMKILRAIEYQSFEMVGSNRTISTDIRFIFATNKNLRYLIKEGLFREDLYYRINTIVIEIPPLRKRSGDIPLLLEHFIKIFSVNNRAPIFSIPTMEWLITYRWPGNVRELKNFSERFCILHPGETILPNMLPRDIMDPQVRELHQKVGEMTEKIRIEEELKNNNFNVDATARSMGYSASTLRRRIKKHKIRRWPAK